MSSRRLRPNETPPSSPPPSSPAPTSSQQLPGHVIREIAVKSRRHEKSIRKHLRGQPVRPIVAADIEAAMAALGLTVPPRVVA